MSIQLVYYFLKITKEILFYDFIFVISSIYLRVILCIAMNFVENGYRLVYCIYIFFKTFLNNSKN